LRIFLQISCNGCQREFAVKEFSAANCEMPEDERLLWKCFRRRETPEEESLSEAKLTQHSDVDRPLRRVVLLVARQTHVRALVQVALHVFDDQSSVCHLLADVCWQTHFVCNMETQNL
jgi:hypothetical protein